MLYHGIDIIEVRRIRSAVERWGERFLRRVYTVDELRDCGCNDGLPRYGSLAARWAAKEAAAKALGVGLRGLGAKAGDWQLGVGARLSLHDIEVLRSVGGQPRLALHGEAAALAVRLRLHEFVLSLTHGHDYAVASVIGVVE
jgi:holo-[acyl-carrier protein] synthase